MDKLRDLLDDNYGLLLSDDELYSIMQAGKDAYFNWHGMTPDQLTDEDNIVHVRCEDCGNWVPIVEVFPTFWDIFVEGCKLAIMAIIVLLCVLGVFFFLNFVMLY